MKPVRLAIIGVGGMGGSHCRSMQKVNGAELVAVCDINKDIADKRAQEFGCKKYYSSKALFASGVADAVVIATPHYDHTTIGIEALKKGLHVLVEKPISVHKADCHRLIAAHKRKKQVFAAMFNQRTDPFYQNIKRLVDSGELGEITRVNWIISDWFRTETYYASGGWRATWKGEGGGVLLNQCPHQLDLFQWICGMPNRVRGFCSIGKYHNIEVEDEVTAYVEYPTGATGVFMTSTGEAPGTNRFEICGDRGKVVYEKNTVTFTRNEIGQKKFCKTSKERFAKPSIWHIDIPAKGHGGQHLEILQNFADTIRGKARLIAPAAEGIRSVEIGNAMLYSSISGRPVDLPLDAAAFERMLKKLIRNSRYVKKTKKVSTDDMGSSF